MQEKNILKYKGMIYRVVKEIDEQVIEDIEQGNLIRVVAEDDLMNTADSRYNVLVKTYPGVTVERLRR